MFLLRDGPSGGGCPYAGNPHDGSGSDPSGTGPWGSPGKKGWEGDDTILVPIDFSSDSLEAARQAIDSAAAMGTTVLLLHVIHDPAGVLDAGYDAKKARKRFHRLRDEAADRMAETIREQGLNHRAQRAGIKLKTTFARGEPTRCILDVAAKKAANLIVMGCSGLGGISSNWMEPVAGWMGSTAERVVQLASAPVLVVKDRA
ncbi:MAG: universal stress protein [Magnetococcales bacterium]|nr:universal stress protein [Magnetococcales bacterium]